MEPLGNSAAHSEPWLQWGVVIGASLAAAILDVRHGRIPNMLTLPLWIAGLTQATYLGSMSGLVEGVEVSVLLALPFIVLFLLGRGGAGDAKLMGAIGAWLSFDEGMIVFCCVAITGMVLAILRIAAHHERKSVLAGLLASLYLFVVAWSSGTSPWRLLASTGEGETQEQAGPLSLPYGAAIFIGVCISAAGVRIWT